MAAKILRQVQQVIRMSLKYLKICFEDDEEEELSWDIVDFCLSSPSFIFKFVDAVQTEWKLGHAGRLGYLDAISDLIDFRKIHGASSETVLRNLARTEVHLKRNDPNPEIIPIFLLVDPEMIPRKLWNGDETSDCGLLNN